MSRKTGNIGEQLALAYLVERGFKIVEKNWTITGGEIDIIAIKNKKYHFIEVKYRTSTLFGSATESLTSSKKKTLLRSVQIYCMKNKINTENIVIDFLAIQKENNQYVYDFFENIEI